MAVARGVLGRPALPISSAFTRAPKCAPPIDCASISDLSLKSSGAAARLPAVCAAPSAQRNDCALPSTSSKWGKFPSFSLNSWTPGIASDQGTRRGFFSMAAATSETLSPADETEYKIQEKILAHQKAAAKLSHLDEARTLVHQTTLGTLSTISQKYDGAPFGSMVTYATDEDGSIVLSISSLSPHTRDLEENPKCSLLVPKDPSDRTDTIITIIGEATTVSDEDEALTRAAFLSKHPGAFWVDFGDFRFVRIQPKKIRYVSGLMTGLAAVGDYTSEQYRAASVDPISQFGAAIAGHMNRDHAQQTAQIVENSLGVKVDSALMQDVDKLGFGVLAIRQGKSVKLRIPFPQPAEDQKAVRTLVVAMLKQKEDTLKEN